MPPIDPILLLLGLLIVAVLVAAIAIRRALIRSHAEPGMNLLQNQVHALAQQNAQQMEQFRGALQQINVQLNESMGSTRKAMDDRLEGAARLMHNVQQTLGALGETNRQVLQVGKDLSGLQEALRAPKLRGQIGELFLHDLLAQILPAEHFQMQHRFQGGEIVDAMIRLAAGAVPVDAKFPLENFRRTFAAGNDADRQNAKKVFVRDVKTHIDAIAKKYIRPDEGTLDFALMYIPAENVYYEIIIRDDADIGGGSPLFDYALARRVIPVSPNSFYAYLQTILLGLRGLRIEENARRFMDHLAGIHQELDHFQDTFRIVGKHLEDSSKKYREAEQRLGRIQNKIETMDQRLHELDNGTAPLA